MSTPIQLIPGTFVGCYPENPNDFNVAIITLAQAFLDQNFPGIYVGPTSSPPPVDQRDRVWVNSDNQKIYQYFGGQWQRKYEFAASSPLLQMWTGSPSDLNTFDGGSAGAVSDSTGPLWEIVSSYEGRVPIGVGAIPGASPAANITAVGDTIDSLGATGEYKHTLTDLEGAIAVHTHAFGVCDPASDDGVFRIQASSTVPSWGGHFITGSGSQPNPSETTANLFTLPSGTDGAGVTAVGHNNMQPYKGTYFIRRTARIYVQPPY